MITFRFQLAAGRSREHHPRPKVGFRKTGRAAGLLANAAAWTGQPVVGRVRNAQRTQPSTAKTVP
jgi:hypothetical protein